MITTIQSIDYKDWFINQKRIPSKDSQEYKEFFDFHKDLCINGAMVGGVYINPFLYWHLNMWHTEVDIIDDFEVKGFGNVNRTVAISNLKKSSSFNNKFQSNFGKKV